MAAHLRLVPKPRPPSQLRLVPLTAELLAMAATAEVDPAQARLATRPDVMVAALLPGLSFAAIDGGEIIAAGGISPLWHGHAQGWMLVTTLATRRHMAAVTRIAAEHFEAWGKLPAYRRIEVHIRADRPWRESFARRLGMTEGFGPLKAWDSAGRDYWMYARVA